MSVPRRVAVVDDHPIVRDGVKQLLSGAEDLVFAGEAGDADEALAMLGREPVDVLIVDLGLPGRSGLEVLRDVRRRLPDVAVLVFSVHAQEEFAVRAIRAGAAGYLQKGCPARELLEAIRTVAEGHIYVPPSVGEQLARELRRGEATASHAQLSDRELEVLRLIAAGKSAKEVGAVLSLSKSTVSTYRARILEKLGLRSNAEITRYALAHGLVN